jgi:hypothetical protein
MTPAKQAATKKASYDKELANLQAKLKAKRDEKKKK